MKAGCVGDETWFVWLDNLCGGFEEREVMFGWFGWRDGGGDVLCLVELDAG